MEHCKQKNYTLQTKLQHATNKKQTVKKWNTANKRITRFKLNSRKLQTTFSSPEAALLLVSTKNCDLLSRFLAWSNEIPVLNGFVNTIDWDQNQSDLVDLSLSMRRVAGSPWIADFRCQKSCLWGRECANKRKSNARVGWCKGLRPFSWFCPQISP